MPPVDLANHPQLGIYAEDIRECAAEIGVDPLVIAAMILIESSGNPNAYNARSKAIGLLQIIPVEGGIAGRPTIAELRSPLVNIQTGCSILREYLDLEDGNLEGALRRYSGYRDKPWEAFVEGYLSKFQDEMAKLKDGGPPPMSARELKELNIPSLHYGPREGVRPSWVVVHSTATPAKGTLTGTVGYLRENNLRVSIHELVGPGIVYRMVPDNMTAYHAGWKTSKLPNGIKGELINVHSWGIEAFQIAGQPTAPDVVEILIQRIVAACKRLNIPPGNVLGHGEVDPKRRSDPVGVSMSWLRGEVEKRLGEIAKPNPDNELLSALIALRWEVQEGRRETAQGNLAAVEARLRDNVEFRLTQMINARGAE